MSRFRKTVAVWMLFPLLLTGCWDIKNIQDINYLTCVGFDYVDDKYVVIVQMIDFSSVAKTESAKPTQPVPVWVGRGTGQTLVGAFNDLYLTAQLRIFYGQVNTIVLSENVMKKGFNDVEELIDRYYEIRLTPWVFGTKEPIEELFAIAPFFNLSPLMSMLHQPQEIYKQQSLIAPMTIREFFLETREPGNSTLLPSLGSTKRHWRSNEKPKEMIELDGVFVFKGESYKGWIDWRKVPGIRWTQRETQRSPMLVRSDGKPLAAVSLEAPKVKIKPRLSEGRAIFDMDVKLSGYISEGFQEVAERELQLKAAAQVEEEIRSTFKEGLKLKADVLRLEHALYRKKNREWKALRDKGSLSLTDQSLGNIHVDVDIMHSGKMKY